MYHLDPGGAEPLHQSFYGTVPWTLKQKCTVQNTLGLRPERTGRLAIEAIRSITSAVGNVDSGLKWFEMA